MSKGGRPKTFVGVRDWLWPGVSGLDAEFRVDRWRDVLVIEILGERLELTRRELEEESWPKKYGDWLAGVRERHGVVGSTADRG